MIKEIQIKVCKTNCTLGIIYTDSDCCNNDFPERTETIHIISGSHRQVDVNPKGKSAKLCFSWRVIANCESPESITSGKECADNNPNDPPTEETEGPTKRNKINTETTLIVYPNPTAYDLTIEVINLLSEEVTISIVTLHGQQVFATKIGTEQGAINYTWTPKNIIAPGVYFVNVIDQDKTIHRQFEFMQ